MSYQSAARLLAKIRTLFLPPPDIKVSDWADEERRLSPEASAEPGQWLTSRAEYQRGIMDAFSDPNVETVVIMSSAQVGKTEILNNVIGYHVSQDPSPMLVVQPTLDMAQTWSKDRLAPMLRDTPILQGLVKDPRARDSGNTTLHKIFPGGHITACGANSPSSLASRPVRLVLCDEVDRYPVSAGSEGDPVSLARKRATTFWNRKIGMFSTPTNKANSRIETAFEESDKRFFYVPCLHCGHKQTLKWAQVRWEPDQPESAAYACVECGTLWTDAERVRSIRQGEWVATSTSRRVAGFHLSALYSPWTNLEAGVIEFLEAKKQPATLRVWVNTFLGEAWEEAGEAVDDYAIAEHREDWGEMVPKEVLMLTAGVDVQDDRLEVEIVGWGRDEESWSIDYRTIYGDPSSPAVWSDLDSILAQRFEREDERELVVRAACIDSGGHHTSSVYNYVRPREGKRFFAIKGVGGEGKPLVGKPTRNNIGKIRLFPVGVDSAKDLLFSRMRIKEVGPGYMHFPLSRSDEYFRQLTAEKLVTRYHKGFARREWVKTRPRNEALDVRVYSMAALGILNLNLNTLANREFMARENPPDKPIPQENVRNSRRMPQKNGGFINGWR
jgi:phage terminase large subunit GpA-like protein